MTGEIYRFPRLKLIQISGFKLLFTRVVDTFTKVQELILTGA
jgi:hypothetical protein